MVAVTDAYSCCAPAEGCRLSGQPSHLSSRCIDKCLNRYAGPPPAWRCFPFVPAWDMSQPIQISLCEWSAGVAYRDAILHPAAIFAQKKNTVKICSRSTSSGPDRTNGRKSSFVQGLFVLTGQDERPANEPYRSKQVIVSKRRRSVWVMVRDRPFLLFVRLGGKHGSGLKRDARANGTNRLPPPRAAAGTAFLVTTPRSKRRTLC